MPNRYIKETCVTSPTLTALSDAAERFFWRLTTVADDYGLFDANLAVLQGRCVPTLEWARKKVEKCLAELTMIAPGDTLPLVQLYQVRGRTYGIFTNWKNHQRDRSKEKDPPKPKFPRPEEGSPLSPRPAATCGELRQIAALNESEERRTKNEYVSVLPQAAANGTLPPPVLKMTRKARIKTGWPEDFAFTARHQAIAEGFGLNVHHEFVCFRDKAQANGWLYADWDAAFRNWLNHEVKYKQARAK